MKASSKGSVRSQMEPESLCFPTVLPSIWVICLTFWALGTIRLLFNPLITGLLELSHRLQPWGSRDWSSAFGLSLFTALERGTGRRWWRWGHPGGGPQSGLSYLQEPSPVRAQGGWGWCGKEGLVKTSTIRLLLALYMGWRRKSKIPQLVTSYSGIQGLARWLASIL